MLKPYFIAAALLSAWLALAHGAERRPKECDEATALEEMRESRIEAEFSRRGISDPVEKINRRAEIESEIDTRIRIVKDICEKLTIEWPVTEENDSVRSKKSRQMKQEPGK